MNRTSYASSHTVASSALSKRSKANLSFTLIHGSKRYLSAAMRGCIAGGVELKDRSWRLLALRSLLNTALTPLASATLDYLLHHFAR